MARIQVTGENCLAILRPDIAAQWHPTKNEGLTPNMVRVKGVAPLWWICEKGHEWQAPVSARVAGLGCPVCLEIGKYIRGKNDLLTLCSGIAAQWHPVKNGDLKPRDVSSQSNQKVWWKCEKGHEWRTSVQGRVRQNSACPFCSGHRLIKGVNDLAVLFPDVAAQWDYEMNEKGPEEYKPTCPDKVSWICEKKHQWLAKIENRTRRGQKCPYCYGRVAIPGETDVATRNPEVLRLWDTEKNGAEGITPENTMPCSDRRIWCKCGKGHSWRTQVKHITYGEGCPYCRNQKIIPGENDFATLAPAELLRQWHPEKNGYVRMNQIPPHYRNRVWWLCEKGHEWFCSPDSRLRNGTVTKCPYCAGLYVIKGENDLHTQFPEIAEDFYSAKNRRKPEDVHYRTRKKVWWKCHVCGYEWRCCVASRTRNGSGCPRCHGKVRRSRKNPITEC